MFIRSQGIIWVLKATVTTGFYCQSNIIIIVLLALPRLIIVGLMRHKIGDFHLRVACLLSFFFPPPQSLPRNCISSPHITDFSQNSRGLITTSQNPENGVKVYEN